jgi:hypothetical protein
LGNYNFGQVLAGQTWYFNDWPSWTQGIPGWHTLRVVVDPDDLITEANESNNTWERQFYWQPTCNDSYEDNDTYDNATSLSFDQTRNADICGPGDYDYYWFTGTAGQRIVIDIDAQVDSSLLDPYVSIIGSDGFTTLAENDDEVPGLLDSRFGYELPYDGVYFIRVRAWDHPNAGGPDYFYEIRLLQDNTAPRGEITSPLNGDWLDPTLENVVVTASDDQSGISHVDFFWHDADWSDPDWVWLGDDWDGSDGWSWDFDTESQPEQDDGAFCIWVTDWAGNWIGDCTWQLGIDRTPPYVSASASPMYGDAPFLDFWVNWWDSWDNMSGVANYDVQYRDGAGGDWVDLLTGTTETNYRFVGQNGHTYYFRARARDHAGNIGTYAGGNGDVFHAVQVCATAADAYESDDGYTTAQWIETNGAWQAHNVHVAGDEDWVKFVAEANKNYVLVTANTGGHADTVLWLYNTDGTTLLDTNDDDPNNWPASRLEWQTPANGTYYVKIDHWDPYAFGCTTGYELSVSAVSFPPGANSVFLPIILKNRP